MKGFEKNSVVEKAKKHVSGIVAAVGKGDADATQALNELLGTFVKNRVRSGMEIAEAYLLALDVAEALIDLGLEGVALGMVWTRVCNRSIDELADRALKRNKTFIAIGTMKGN